MRSSLLDQIRIKGGPKLDLGGGNCDTDLTDAPGPAFDHGSSHSRHTDTQTGEKENNRNEIGMKR